jgi:hypothetical protein
MSANNEACSSLVAPKLIIEALFRHRDYQGFKVQTAAVVARIREWSSHAADAFGLLAISYADPARVARFNRKLVYAPKGIV